MIDFRIYHVPSTSDKGSLSRSNQLHSIEEGASSPNLNANPDLSGRLSYRDYLEYFIYSGLIYVGLKQWENALFCFEVALTVPTTGPLSMLMSEAYKRWLLVGLLSKGKVCLHCWSPIDLLTLQIAPRDSKGAKQCRYKTPQSSHQTLRGTCGYF